ncbi:MULTISPECIES: tail fiber assembly protein [unclassified Pseudomonas]|uniref:tail fiber assembly protein n=1 Tax=unclassified Pseudomonas TaxID=196821 RepID=UPI000CD0C966|nr:MULTISPECIES: tail fiber assembly protein [unclassified Pseudomonas]POA26313.1 phage tail protein [Pseudomonas sp. FW305-3-2-15-E-TSA4]POA44571.1 phage tail protein [Pseudomonas sp. FW305-3-2-15-E-TSA2]
MNIDWSRLITKAMKEQVAADQALAMVVAEIDRRRVIADKAIAPLQDAVDIDDATDADVVLLKAWKKYRVALNRLPDEPGYPSNISWPVTPH